MRRGKIENPCHSSHLELVKEDKFRTSCAVTCLQRAFLGEEQEWGKKVTEYAMVVD